MNAGETQKVDFSIIAPMYNERENVARTVEAIKREMDDFEGSWEFIMVDDGSTDGSREEAEKFCKEDPRFRVVGYSTNCGRGRALRTGMAAARGDIIATTDFDLSYAPEHLKRMYAELKRDPEVDAVLGSAYMPGGSTSGVPWFRLFVSKAGNRILRFTLGGRFHTITCILRAYRRNVLRSLELESDGKEIHLEILSKLMALGYRVKEIPAHLTARKKGRSKFRFRATTISHLLFSAFERPMILFGFVGMLFLILGFLVGVYLLAAFWHGRINPDQPFNPERPLMTVLVVLLLGGIQVLSFGFLAVQILGLRRQLYIVQKENRLLEEKVSRMK